MFTKTYQWSPRADPSPRFGRNPHRCVAYQPSAARRSTGRRAGEALRAARRAAGSGDGVVHSEFDQPRARRRGIAAAAQRGRRPVGGRRRGRSGKEHAIERRHGAPRRRGGQVSEHLAVRIDLTHRKQLEEELRQRALTDTLTQLPNRAVVLDRLQLAIARARRMQAYHFAVLFMDFDRFKVVNDSLARIASEMRYRAGPPAPAPKNTASIAAMPPIAPQATAVGNSLVG